MGNKNSKQLVKAEDTDIKKEEESISKDAKINSKQLLKAA